MARTNSFITEDQCNVTDAVTGRLTVTNSPQQITSVNHRRTGTRVTNLGYNEIYYGGTPSVSPGSGDLLAAGRGESVFVKGASMVFVVCDVGITNPISWAEYYE